MIEQLRRPHNAEVPSSKSEQQEHVTAAAVRITIGPARLTFTGSQRRVMWSPRPARGPPPVTDTVRYYHTDAIGSVRVITDEAGAIVERHDYLPFGEEWQAPDAASTEPRRFAGKERDPETGLDYFGARYLETEVGRFISVDPVYKGEENLLDPQRWNRYAYVANRPIVFVDPDGRALTPADVAFIAMDVASLTANIAAGNAGGAVIDVVGLAADLIPGVPSVAGLATRGARLAKYAQFGRDFERAALKVLELGGGAKQLLRLGERTRIPDAVNRLGSLIEVKGVRNLYLTNQIGDFVSLSSATKPLLIVVDGSTQISRAFKELIASGKVVIIRLVKE